MRKTENTSVNDSEKDTNSVERRTTGVRGRRKINKKIDKKAVSGTIAKVVFRLAVAGVLILGCTVVGLLLGVVVGCILTTEPVEYDIVKKEPTGDYVSHMYNSAGEEIGTLRRLSTTTSGEWVDIELIPKDLQYAFVAIEDERFYEHDGVDLKRTLSAVAGYVVPGMRDHGGSTITQQLVKNLTGEDERSIPRKVREQWRALQLDRELQKDEIMEMYLNIIYFANGAYGVQDAAQTYFGKDVSELSLAECAFLAGITNSPGKYNPATMLGRTNAYDRQVTILDAMLAQNRITKAQYIDAIQTELVFVSKESQSSSSDGSSSTTTSSVYTYFMDMVIGDVRSDLMEMGYSKKDANDIIYNQGVQIYTTQNPEIQKIVDEEYCDKANFPVNTSDSSDPDNAQSAIVIMDQSNGQVIAVYGGYGKKLGSLSWNRATSIQRQPGSAIKPILVYGPLIDMGEITAATAMDEEPAYMDPANPDSLWPANSDHQYHGLKSVRIALYRSYNVFAVTMYRKNITSCLTYMKNVGIDRTGENHLSMALGGFTNGVSPMDMAAAYVPIANGGTYYEPVTYTKVIDKDGNVIIDKSGEKGTAIYKKTETSTVMTSLLSSIIYDNRGTGTGARLVDKNGVKMPASGKTGTTNDKKDYWFVGYTPYYTCAVWYGYDNQTVISSAESGAAVKIWKKVMQRIHDNLEAKNFETYGSVEKVYICSASGKRSTSACWNDPRCSWFVCEEVFAKGTAPSAYCDLHVTKKVCTISKDKYGKNCLASSSCTSTKTVTGTYRKTLSVIEKEHLPEDWSYELSHTTCSH
ncbi:MAG: penicillin-binding protein [Ruminococcaceae bacterium]|nr:penicillin-binding protein [Oscillospiraceae bacterium]